MELINFKNDIMNINSKTMNHSPCAFYLFLICENLSNLRHLRSISSDLTPLHKYIVEQYQAGENAREIKEQELASKKQRHNEKLYGYLNLMRELDGEAEMQNNIINLLDAENTFESALTLYHYAISYNNSAKAKQAINKLKQFANRMEPEQSERIYNVIDMIELNSLLNTLSSEEDKKAKVEAKKALLNSLLDIDDAFALQASDLLFQYAGGKERNEILLPTPGAHQKNKIQNKIAGNKYNFNKNGEVLIYPNPSQDVINIEYALPCKDKIIIKVFDVYGKCMYQKIENLSLGKLQIDISKYSDGIYFVDFNGIIKEKIIKIQ